MRSLHAQGYWWRYVEAMLVEMEGHADVVEVINRHV